MSNPRYGAVPAGHQGFGVQFVNADALLGKVVLEAMAAAAAGATSPLYYGGASVYDLTAYSTDSVSHDVLFYKGTVLTTVGASTGAAATTTSTITRASGSFISDGWRAGQQVMILSAPTESPQAVEGILCNLTSVAAGALTFSGTPLSALSLTTNTRIVALAGLWTAPVAAGAGNSGTAPEAWILSSTSSSATRVKDEKFGTTQVLVAAMKVAVTASTVVSINGDAARY